AGLPADALRPQRDATARARRRAPGGRPGVQADPAAAGRFLARGQCAAALADRAASAGAGLRAAGGAAVAQLAAAGALRIDAAGLPGLPGGHLPDDPRHPVAGRGSVAGRGGIVVAAAADAGAGRVAVRARRPRRQDPVAIEMMLRPKLHDHYIARTVILTVLATWGVLLGLDVVLAFAGEFDDLGKGSYTINHAIAATALTIPWRTYNLFPTSAVIGALLGLGQLAATSELTALRALGLSRRRLSLSVAIPLALLT